jgi:hypothetical protein
MYYLNHRYVLKEIIFTLNIVKESPCLGFFMKSESGWLEYENFKYFSTVVPATETVTRASKALVDANL